MINVRKLSFLEVRSLMNLILWARFYLHPLPRLQETEKTHFVYIKHLDACVSKRACLSNETHTSSLYLLLITKSLLYEHDE